MTIGEAAAKVAVEIQDIYTPEEAKAISQFVVGHVCGISNAQLIIKKDDPLYTMEERSILFILDELLTGKPLQYIVGETEFFGLRIKVTPAVLIPRPETEELVSWILEECKKTGTDNLEVGAFGSETGRRSSRAKVRSKDRKVTKILDIGTGSGCIAIALKKYLPEAEVTALDVSFEALVVAKQNARLNNLKVQFIQADILHLTSRPKTSAPYEVPTVYNPELSYGLESTIRYSVIVSNPPYVTQAEKTGMHQNVLDYEPHRALFVPDDEPLLFYNAIADFAVSNLDEHGLLFLEINEALGEETLKMLQAKGFKNGVIRKDMQGKDRMIRAELLPAKVSLMSDFRPATQ